MTVRHRRRRRPARRRKLRRWYRRQDRLTQGLLIAVVALGALVAALIVTLPDRERPGRRSPRTAGAPSGLKTAAIPRESPAARPPARYPVRPRREPPAAITAPSRPTPERAAGAPRAAIIIDDLGQRLSHLEQLASLGIPLTIAVIPGLPATAATVREATRLGIEMILHQPMEPREEGGKDAGAGVLLTSMSSQELRARLREGLAAVPGAAGVNNHMGSRFTEDLPSLGVLMAELKARDLFWLDSRTTAATRGAEVARAVGVPALERDVFLDAEAGPDAVRRQVRRLIAIARGRGTAVGIGHPRPDTIAALRELRDELTASGVTLVPLSALVPAAHGGAAAVTAVRSLEDGRAGRTAAAASP